MTHVVVTIEEAQEIVIIHLLLVVEVLFMLLNQEVNSIIALIDLTLNCQMRDVYYAFVICRVLFSIFFFRVQKNELRGFFPFLLIKHIFVL
jgi:hypothetical protein